MTREGDPDGAMRNPLQILVAEHRRIEDVLDVLAAWGRGLDRGTVQGRDRLRDIVRFLRGYADAVHHGKEERILFRILLREGAPAELGAAIAGVQRDHETARMLTDDLARAAGREGPWEDDERRDVLQVVAEYVSLLRRHIVYEDDVLFPAVARHLSDAALEETGRSFARFADLHEAEERNLCELARSLSTGLRDHVREAIGPGPPGPDQDSPVWIRTPAPSRRPGRRRPPGTR